MLTFHAGKILNLGADWGLVGTDGKFRADTRYNLQTDDGTHIYIRTEGQAPAVENGPTMLRAKFETALNGTYGWLNNAAGVGILSRNGQNGVIIDMWQVSV
jgi:hypothetical protein